MTQGKAMQGWKAALAALVAVLAGCAEPQPSASPQTAALATPTRYKAVLVAGDPSIRAFDNGTARMAELLAGRGVLAPGDLALFSARDDVVAQGARLATAPAILQAVAAMAPAPGQGCLVFATSHGSPRTGLDLPRTEGGGSLSPRALDVALERGCGAAPTVVVLSGCFSGEYLRGPMLRPNRIVLSAARADRPSFGCGAGNVFTYFDECLLGSLAAAPRTALWRDTAAATQDCVQRREAGRFRPSEPQAWFGAAVAGLPLPLGQP